MAMKEYLNRIMAGENLSQAETSSAFELIMSGAATPSQIAGFIVALRMKGETADEIAGAAQTMRRHAVLIDTAGLPVVDTCGTGGDSSSSFNISTTAAFVVAGAGIPVAKHGNRAISSKCGSADLLAELGVNIEIAPDLVEECIREAGIGFLYAPRLHPAMKNAMTPRKELGVRTIFNMLGPLTNPAGAKYQVIGVFSAALTETFAQVLKLLGSRHALIVHGSDGLDEITATASTRISELKTDGTIQTYEFDPLSVIDDYAALEDLAGGSPQENARITRAILSGRKGGGRSIVCLNAAAAIVAAGKADNMRDGYTAAARSIDSGMAMKALESLVRVSHCD